MNKLLAPNGKPSNLTPEQYKLVRTPAFKEWFGDWEKGIFTDYQKFVEYKHKIGTGGMNILYIHSICENIDLDKAKKIKEFHKKAFEFLYSEYETANKNGYTIDFQKFITQFLMMYKPVFDLVNQLTSNPNIESTKETLKDFQEKDFQEWINYKNKNISKVVDSNGEPLVCYHGSYREFSIFDINKVGNTDKGFFSKGFYFTPNEDLARYYGDKVYKCFLNIKNPIITKSRKDLANYLGFEYNNNTYSEIARDKIISLKYDGVMQENDLPIGVKALYPFIEIVAYYPEQIKLSDGTNTTFDSNNPDIRFDEGGSINDKKQQLNKDMEYKNYAKGGKILGNVILNNENQPIGFNHQEQQKYARIGVTDKYQIQAYIDMGLTGVNFDSVSLAEKLKIEVQKLYDTYTDYLISEDSKGIDAFFLAQIRQAEIDQEPTSVIDQIKENQQNPQKRLEKVNELAESQKYTLESWIYYFKDNLYPNEFIYLMFSAILKFNYNLNKKELISRTNKTTTNITSLSPSALAKLYTNSSNYLLKDYIEILAEEGQNLINEVVTIQADGGTWFTFLGKGNANDEEIKENAQKLTAFVQNTSWCTTSYAYNQLAGVGNYSGQGGNFYVFAEKTENGFKPEIAIRMNHEFVAEISGTLDGQNISPEYSEIAKRYCRLNVPNNSAEEYIDKLNYNIKVGDAIKRLENEGMYPTIMEDYLYVVKNKDGIGKGKYRENPVNKKFFDSVTTAINLPNQYFQANEFSNSVSNLTPITKYFLGDLTLSQGNNFDLGTSSLIEILGKLDIENNSTSFGQLKKIGGDLIISSPTIQSFDSIEYIGGQIIFEGRNLGLTSFGNLTEYGGTINCLTQFTNLIDLGNLVECGDLIIGENSALETTGNLSVAKSIQCSSSKNITFPNLVSVLENCDFNKSQTTDLPALQRVGGNFNINSSRVKIFPQLNFIGGTANFGNNFTTTTQNIERILGDLYLVNSRLKEFTNLTYVKGNIDLKGSLIESLGSIERTDGNIDLSEPNKLKSLGKLEFIGGYFNASGGDITDMGNVKQIIKFANFGSSKIQSLGNLESVGGSLFLKNSVVNNLGNLIFVGRKIEFGNLADLQAQWNQRTGQNENQNFAVGGAIESQKTGNNATLSISLLTRLLELSNEDLKNDLQIHKVVENVSSMSNKALTIDDYNSIIKDVNKFATGGQTEAQKEKVSNVMREFKEGKLKTSYGEKVTNPKQAIAIALSEAGIKRKEDGGVLEISAYEGNIPLSLPEHYYSADSDVELVPVVDLMKFREFDRKKTPKYNAENSNYIINNLKESFKNEGIKEPLIIEYSVDDNSVLLIEGNHRLNTAIDMGLIYLPARVVLRKNKFTPTSKKLSMQVDGMKPNEYGYIPSNLKPSQVGLSQAKKMFLEGGIIEGQLHSECNDETGCGVKFEVGKGGHIIEAERDEAVIVPQAFEINETMTITGTPSQIASALNVLGGGKNFDSGANIESKSFSGKTEQLKPMAKNTDVDYTIDNASIIINRRTMADTGIYKVTGTPKQIASAINSMNGNGVEIGEVGKLEKIK